MKDHEIKLNFIFDIGVNISLHLRINIWRALMSFELEVQVFCSSKKKLLEGMLS